MKFQKLNTVLVSLAAVNAVVGQSVLAQTQQAPPVAPSLLKQAGQMLMEGAQKRVLQGLDQKYNPGAQPGQTTSTPAATTTTTQMTTTTSTRKAPVPCRSWVQPGEKPVACLLCIHGLGLQSNSYEYFGTEESKRGLAVYAIDVRGFGAWIHANGKAQVNFADCLDDVKEALQSIRAANPGVPVYILGESMGGAIALRAASMYPDLIDGLVSSVPAGDRFNQGKTSAKVFLNLLTGFNIANVGKDVVNQATVNQKLRDQWEGDPLARLNLSPQELIQFQEFMNNNHDAAKKVTDMPVLFLEGNGDHLVKPEGTWELFNDVVSTDKSFFAVPGEHLIFEEAQTQEAGPRDQNFRVIQSWLTAKVGRRHRGNWGGGYAGAPGGNPGGNGGWNGGPGGNPGGNAGWNGAPGDAANNGWNGGPNGPQGGPGAWGGGNNGMQGNPGGGLNLQGLEGPAQMIANAQYTDAIAALDAIRAQQPQNPNVLALEAKAYYKSGDMTKASFFSRRAMRMSGYGGGRGRAFNSYVFGTAPTPAVYGGSMGAATAPAGTVPGGGYAPANSNNFGTTGRSKVYAFVAAWADQCKDVNDTLRQLTQRYPNAVDVQSLNIEDSSSDSLADQFNVGPIPTVVFVGPSGKVGATIIGDTSLASYEKALQSLR